MKGISLSCRILVLAALLPALACAQNARITATVLEVKMRPSASAVWRKAGKGTQLANGAQVRTGKRSKCEIKFPDGSLIRMAPLSDLVIVRIAGKDMSMGRGKLYARIIKGTTARIQGGTGVASIRGTVLEFDAGAVNDPRRDTRNALSIFEGLADLEAGGGTESVGPQARSTVGGDGTPTDPEPIPPEKFAGIAPRQWWNDMVADRDILTMPSSFAGVEQKLDTITSGRMQTLGAPGRFPLLEGRLLVDVQSAMRSQSIGQQRVAAAPLATALDFPGASAWQTPPLRPAFGKRFFGPKTRADLFGMWNDEDDSFAGVRVRPAVVLGNVYLEAGGTFWVDDNGGHGILSEAFATLRPDFGDITVGRQHFLVGPVNNSNLGSLIAFDTADAIRWKPRLGPVRFDMAYVEDFTPFRSGSPNGEYFRAETTLLGGTIALNDVNLNGIGNGISFDFALPLVAGKWDVYGEIGSDPWGSTIQTWGSYFPGLYQRYDVDLFVEYADREGGPSLLSLYAYREYRRDWTGFLTAQRLSTDDVTVGVGAIKRFD